IVRNRDASCRRELTAGFPHQPESLECSFNTRTAQTHPGRLRSGPGDITHFSTPAHLLPALERAGLSRPIAVGGKYMSNSAMLVVGSLNMDQIVHVPRIPLRGETLLSTRSLKLAPGGKGAN